MTRTRFMVAGAAALLAGIVLYACHDYLTVDACLDRGGAWDYELQTCDTAP